MAVRAGRFAIRTKPVCGEKCQRVRALTPIASPQDVASFSHAQELGELHFVERVDASARDARRFRATVASLERNSVQRRIDRRALGLA